MRKEAALPERLLARLGYAVFEDSGSGALTAVGSPPQWFSRVFGDAAAGGGKFLPADYSPFLENFLEDAARAWTSSPAERAESGPWIERGADGREVALEAEACVVDGRHILLIANHQQRFDETSSRLQTAREEKLAHERLRREIQTKEILLHCIVHDLSQPLTALRGCLSLLTMGLPPEKVREVVDIADRQTRKQEGMIRDVLKAFSSEMAALQSGGPRQSVDLATAAREVVAEYAAAFSSQGATLALDSRLDAPGDWLVTGEPDRLRRLFTNFLENALRYSPAGTTTTVGVEPDGQFLRAFVDDQGPGLPEGITAANLFRLFGKGKESTGKAGLGLYFCKITAERWGGGVGCENRSSGGTRFWFRLPLAPRPARAPDRELAVVAAPPHAGEHPAEDSSGKPQKAERPLRILLADDLAINRQLIEEMLEQRGHRVQTVNGGRAAVAAAQENVFDVILMDVEMPGMNGLEAARAIRASELPLGRSTPILAVTANDSTEDREHIRQAGMDGHLRKPFGRDGLYRAVEDAASAAEPSTAASHEAASTDVAPESTTGAPPAASADPLSKAAIVARFGGDARLAAQLARMFLKDAPRLLGSVRRAARRGDSDGLARSAHALKGAVGHFGALAARSAAARLEDLGRRGDRKGVKLGLEELDEALDALRKALLAMTARRSAAPAPARTPKRRKP
ncbi:MAG TPA: response regulator [Candidatus Acidoferrales bacterium]|nr:response regulator [Candidatus Acidoferrales bacterium]